MFEYRTLTVKIRGAKSGIFSVLQSKGLEEQSGRDLTSMGRDGWELTGVIPLAVGAVGGQWVDSAICFFKRPLAVRKVESESSVRPGSAMLEAGEFKVLLDRCELSERMATETGLKAGLSSADWRLITSTACPEALPAVEDLMASAKSYSEEQVEKDIKEFYRHLGRTDQMRASYRLIEISQALGRALAVELIEELQLLDLQTCIRLIGSSRWEVKTTALKTLFSLKPEFTVEDVQAYVELLRVLSVTFVELPLREKRSILGSAKKVWDCPQCETEVPETEPCCLTCSADRHGIPYNFGHLHGLTRFIERRLAVLRREFKLSEMLQ